MLARSAFPAFLLTLLAFILFLLVTLSSPYIKNIGLAVIDNRSGTRVMLGVFGACYKTPVGIASELGIDSTGCLPAKLGYRYAIDGGETLTGRSPSVELVSPALSRALVLNPITVTLTGVSLIMAACAYFLSKRIYEILAFVSLLLSVIFGWVAFGINHLVADRARYRLSRVVFTYGPLGNAVWMSLGAAIALTLATCAAGVGMFGRYSRKQDKASVQVSEKP